MLQPKENKTKKWKTKTNTKLKITILSQNELQVWEKNWT